MKTSTLCVFVQAIAGAVSTATHGTGHALGSLADQVVALRLLLADGSARDCAESDANPDFFHAARVSLGALGVISTLTLKIVPQFRLVRQQDFIHIDALCERLPALLAAHARVEWFWEPYTTDASLLLRLPTDEPIAEGCWRADGVDLEEEDHSRAVDVSYKALGREACYPDLYTEIEMFVPIEHAAAAFRDFRAFEKSVRKQRDQRSELQFGCRYVAAERSWLSPMYGDSAQAVFSFLVGGDEHATGSAQEFALHAAGLEQVCLKYGGRPHWGKRFTRELYDFSALYPRWAEFCALRHSVDPRGMFVNDWVERVFSLQL
jgi:FAD/FMN-containing dehydrogenase